MSFNQSRAERSDSSQYRKSNRSGSSAQPRNFSGGGRKGGGGTAPLPSSSSYYSSSSNNRSFKKADNAPGGQSRVTGSRENLDSNYASAARTLQNGSHLQPPVHGAANAPVAGVAVKPATDMSTHKSIQAVPKAPFSQPVTVNSGSTAPATPEKASGDASKSFSLQFGSISPGFMNGMQIPARTSSAPPNLDEQQRDQARHDSLRTGPTFPIPSVPKKQGPRKDGSIGDQSNTGESHQISKAKGDAHVSSASPVTQTQKASFHHIPGGSMPMPFNQPQIPTQFGGPIPHIQSQGMAATSLPMPMGNAPQLQQPIFFSSLQPHPLHPQGIMPQSQGLNFTPQMGAHLPPQLGNLGISSVPQFAQHQAGKLGVHRKPVKITHPDTHEELRLDGSSGSRSHPNVPQSQSITSVLPAHPINYYSNTYNPNSLFFSAPSSVPLTSTQINSSSQAARFSYPVSQGPQTVSFMNSSSHNSYASKTSVPLHGIAEPSSLEQSRDVHNAVSLVPSASVQVTVKPVIGLHVEKVADSLRATSSASVEKGESPEFFQQPGEASSIHLQRDSEALRESPTQQPKPSLETTSTSLGKQSNVASPFSVEGTVPNSLSSSSPHPLEKSVPAVTDTTENRKEAISRSESIKNQQKHQVPVQSTSVSSLPSQSLEHNNSFNTGITEAIVFPSSNTGGGMAESTRELSSTHTAATTSAPEIKTDSDGRGSTCESPRMLGSSALFDSLDTDHYASQNDSSLVDKPLKLETMRRKEQGVMFNEGPKQDKLGSETSPGVVSIKSLDVVDQTEVNSITKLTTNSHDVQSLGIAEKDLEELVIHRKKDDWVADNLVISNSPVLDDTAAKTSSSKPSLSTSSNGDNKDSISNVTCTRSDNLGSGQVVTNLSDEGEAPVSTISSVSEPTLKREGEGTEDVNAGLVSLPAAGSKDNPILELTRSKKKRKEILQRADAAGTTSDLYMAYKGPEEKKETAASSESIITSSSINSKQVLVDTAQDDVSGEKAGQSKAEPDDWEDAADSSTPKLETGKDGNYIDGGLEHHCENGSGVIAKKYSRDFLMKFSEQCTDLPEGFEITTDLDALMVSNVNAFRESSPSPGRITDRPSGLSRSDRRASGPLVTGRDPRVDAYGGNFRPGNFGVSRNTRALPVQYAGGILSGPMQSLGSQGGLQRNNSDSDRRQRATSSQKGLIPSPQTPSQVMHKAEKKYEVGKITDEEQSKQRQLKAILNKLTPQNFEKLFEQVKAVNIDSAITLTGVISQIFDKALMEPTFCEMYANFCSRLAGELPDFSEDNEKITFRRLLLNKCQEEFERGEREQEEADRADEVKQSEEEREEKRIQARRRMLGNIRLIGELYKKKMLTERIMDECIKKLLGQYQNPDEENIEALCKLMSTIGQMIDHPKAKEHIDAYFDMMASMSNNMKLSSRVRFMLRDSIDLRKNKWQQRRKVEGPKKIEEVHRDAAQERQVQAGRLARGPSMNSSVRNRQPMDFVARGSSMLPSPSAQMGSLRGLPSQLRGYGTQDARMDERHSSENRILSVPLPQRPIVEDSITLGPQGGLARGMSIRGQPSMPNTPITEAPSPVDSGRMPTGLNGYSSVSDRTGYGSREDLMPRYMPDRFVGPSHDQLSIQDRNVNFGNRDQRNADRNVDRSLPTSPTMHGREQNSAQNISSDKVWPEERLRDMSMEAIKEFYSIFSAKDEKEVCRCVKDLNAPSFYPTMISIWVTDSFERKDMERDLLAKLLINLSTPRDGMLNEDHLIKGFESVLGTLEDAINDAPKAGEFLGRIFAKIVVENVIPFTKIGQLIYEGGEEQGSLVEMGLAAEVVGTILETIESEKGESVLNEIRTSSSLKIDKFRPPGTNKSLRLDKFI
ncbi:eukaryotic translation initiation factor 4G-like isoform X1 [Actinidia eriantha]|uniref:eukaryotic translation initiation factor 4G-like isoform X1 n=1 Tax=Actinidia eriantha TaxID=165200 RepID=UPI00258C0E1B|nr:eukaryotic translation initiation factor 4G-like isoform X1 [Actinidia eriantha]XP_057513834.1 eukaryotic translation initiation factor 4G-like isoform X1 [Actinidia eriantha]